MHYFKFNIGDYASHTRHLSPIEDIAYRRLLDLAYTSEKPLTDDIRELSRLINMREFQQEIIDILNEFWEHVAEGWINNRVFKELETTGIKSESASRSAKMRWDKVKEANEMRLESECNANASNTNANAYKNDATHNPLPITHNPKPKETKPSAAFALPDWINKNHWDVWVAARKKMTKEQKQMQVEKLLKWKNKGLDYATALENAASNGWQGLVEPKINGHGYKTADQQRSENMNRSIDIFLGNSSGEVIDV